MLLAIAADIAEVCPDATLLNYTNPMVMLMWALSRARRCAARSASATRSRTPTSCSPRSSACPLDEIDFSTAGVNHQAFVLRFERDGESLYPALDAAIERDPDGLGRRVRVEMYRQLGYFPTESSEHSAEYLPWFMCHDSRSSATGSRSTSTCGARARTSPSTSETKRRLDAGEPLEVMREGELAPRYIHSIVTGQSGSSTATSATTG